MKLILGSVFERDFAQLITWFAAEASLEVATRFEDNTCKLIRTLLQNPRLGRVRTDLRPADIRSFRVPGFDRYLLFYQVRGGELVLLRLRYGGMNLPALFLAYGP
jgi:plasmid stabilization system protein ParE